MTLSTMEAKQSLAEKITFQDISDARDRIAPFITKTPLLPFDNGLESTSETSQIYLKLENLSSVGSFKHRGAFNAIGLLAPDQLNKGIYTCSTGNFAQAMAWVCRKFGLPCDVIVPSHASEAKLRPTRELGGRVTKMSYEAWFRGAEHGTGYEGIDGTYVHPTCDAAVIAGQGTIGLEILEDLPDVDTILVPFAGGSVACGIALAVKHKKREVKVYGVEVSTATPLTAALEAGKPATVDFKPSLADGLGSMRVMDEIWPLVRRVVDGSIIVTPEQVADAIKLLVEKAHVVAEGAGAVSLAAAMTGKAGQGKVVCVVTGGNIDTNKLITVLQGGVPE